MGRLEGLSNETVATPLSREIREKRAALLIFENKTGTEKLQDFGTMISDWITRGLIETRTPRVVHTSDIQRYAQLASNKINESPSINAEITIQVR